MKPPFQARWEAEILGCASDARDVAIRAQAMQRNADTTANVFTIVDGDGAETVVDLEADGGVYSSKYRTRPIRTVVHIIAVENDGMPLGCCDDDTLNVWVNVLAWSPRRAVLVQGTQFAEAAGCAPEELVGQHFMADLPFGEPPFRAEPGERIEFGNLTVCPPLDEELWGRMGGNHNAE